MSALRGVWPMCGMRKHHTPIDDRRRDVAFSAAAMLGHVLRFRATAFFIQICSHSVHALATQSLLCVCLT